MDATVNHRLSFVDLVEAQDNLKFIDLPGWAGIGAVQYVPADWREEIDKLPEKAQNDINSINLELVQKLKANDSAFSLGKAVDGLACVRFGLITQETDVEELLGLVYATGKEIEESSKLMEQMAELVRKGIEQANKDLEKETESKLLQEGILRQVPLVSSLMNWFSPASKDSANLKGRTFNLVSGTIKSTEETYKNKMQILENIPSPPKVQEPLKSLLKRGNLSTDEGSMSLSINNNEPSILDDPGIDASGISIQTSSAANSRRSSTNNEPSINCTDSETVNHVKSDEPQPSSIEK